MSSTLQHEIALLLFKDRDKLNKFSVKDFETLISSCPIASKPVKMAKRPQAAIVDSNDIEAVVKNCEMKRCVVIAGMFDPVLSVFDEREHNLRLACNIVQALGLSYTPVSAFRMGRRQNVGGNIRPRLMKVVMASSREQLDLLAKATKLRLMAEYRDVFIRRSMSKEERDMEFKKRQARREEKKRQGRHSSRELLTCKDVSSGSLSQRTIAPMGTSMALQAPISVPPLHHPLSPSQNSKITRRRHRSDQAPALLSPIMRPVSPVYIPGSVLPTSPVPISVGSSMPMPHSPVLVPTTKLVPSPTKHASLN
jgi:hypothetical protein